MDDSTSKQTQKTQTWKVDPYVHVLEVEELMNVRASDGWSLRRMIEHRSRNDTDTVTLFWEK